MLMIMYAVICVTMERVVILCPTIYGASRVATAVLFRCSTIIKKNTLTRGSIRQEENAAMIRENTDFFSHRNGEHDVPRSSVATTPP